MKQSLEALRDRGVHFWVAGRSIEGTYRTLDDVAIPASVCSLFLLHSRERIPHGPIFH